MRPKLRRPILRWHGGKWKLAPWILSYFPDHRVYVEAYGGAASVLMQKKRSYAEVYNDLDQAVVNFFRVLRDPVKSKQLMEAISLTPFSRADFNEAWSSSTDAVENARRLAVRCYMGFSSHAHNTELTTGFRSNSNRSGTTPAYDWAHYPEHIPAMIERLKGVVVENRDAIEVMRQHDTPDTLHYVDPPYVWETRSSRKNGKQAYNFEMDDSQHIALLGFLNTLEGMVILSGYDSPLYDEHLPGWHRVRQVAFADGAAKRIEVLWINKAAMERATQKDLFHGS